MANTDYTSTSGVINKLQSLKDKTKLKYHQNKSKCYDAMKTRRKREIFQFKQDPLGKKAGGIAKIFLKLLSLLQFLQTKPQVKSMNTNYYDFYYTVIKNGDENKIEEVVNFDDLYDIFPNHFEGIKNYIVVKIEY